jgi:AcrR family transcriptional regulator
MGSFYFTIVRIYLNNVSSLSVSYTPGTILDAMKSKTIRKPLRRPYRSPLREERATETRERILDGVVQVMARNGIAELSIPLIAKEARVSIPSVYRYFPTKRRLFEALDDYAQRKSGFSFANFPASATPEELANIIPLLFERRESIEPTIAAAMRTRIGYEVRRPHLVERAKYFQMALAPAMKHLSKKEQGWLTDVVFVLTTFRCVQAFKDYLGLDTAEAADRVAWAIRILAQGTSSPAGRKGK